jgi:group I intron endonuclease
MKHHRHPGVYSITHIKSGRRYIGSSKNIHLRWGDHRRALGHGKHICPHLQNAWNKYGPDAFVFDVLEVCLSEPTILVAREQVWMDRFPGKLFNVRDHAEICNFNQHFHGHLTEANVRDILHRYAAGESRESLSERYKTHVVNISRITNRKTWWSVKISPEIDAACRARNKSRNRGAENGNAKLADRIAEIKTRLANGEGPSSIARDLGVTPGAISAIKHKRVYAYD